MAASWAEVCNAALTKLGAETIITLDEDNEPARVCKSNYERCRDYVLAEHAWNCATARASLAALVDAPAFGYSAAFQLPADCLRILDTGLTDFRLEGRTILANESAIQLLYIKKITDPSELSAHLTEAIAAYLAKEISFRLKQDNDRLRLAAQEYAQVLRRAKFIDASEEPVYKFTARTFRDARMAGYSGVSGL